MSDANLDFLINNAVESRNEILKRDPPKAILNWINDLIYWEREAIDGEISEDADFFPVNGIEMVSEIKEDHFIIQMKNNKKYKITIEKIL